MFQIIIFKAAKLLSRCLAYTWWRQNQFIWNRKLKFKCSCYSNLLTPQSNFQGWLHWTNISRWSEKSLLHLNHLKRYYSEIPTKLTDNYFCLSLKFRFGSSANNLFTLICLCVQKNSLFYLWKKSQSPERENRQLPNLALSKKSDDCTHEWLDLFGMFLRNKKHRQLSVKAKCCPYYKCLPEFKQLPL